MMMFCLYESLKYSNYICAYPKKNPTIATSLCIYLIYQWFRQYKNIKEINIEAEYINITESIEVIYQTLYNILNYKQHLKRLYGYN